MASRTRSSSPFRRPPERTGNFSQVLAADKTSSTIPISAVVSGTTITRSPIPNNIIPTNELNPIALAYLKYYPPPNVAGTADGQQNFGNSATTNDNYNNEMGRLDYNMSDRSRLAFNVRKHRLQPGQEQLLQ